MPPVFAPNQPVPASWAPAGGWRSEQAAPAAVAPDQAAEQARRWDAKIAEIQAALTQSAGFERMKLERQMQDAQEGRKNAYRIAQLSAETSRYGTDVNRELELARLQQQQAQFEQNHGLAEKQYGLSVAEAYLKSREAPAMRWSAKNFDDAMVRVGQGLGPQQITTASPRPEPRSWESFAALAGYEQLPAVQAGGQMTAEGRVAPAGPSGQAAAPDPRMKALKAISDAIPPSMDPGEDDNDAFALEAIRNVYLAGAPGSLERLGPARRKIAQAGLRQMGYDPALMEENYLKRRPGQGSVRSA